MSREAMKLALEALEVATTPLAKDRQEVLRAQAALREALANEALDRMAENARELGLDYEPAQQEPVDFASLLREAEELVREKPTWKRFIEGTPLSNDIAVWMTVFAQDVARRTSPPAQQEPVAWMELLREARDNCKASIVEEGISTSRKEYRVDLEARLTAALNTSPPAQRTWVGLTDEEVEQACVPLGAAMLSFTEVSRAIEAKLKEKNGLHRQHVIDGSPCWCEPETSYTDPETGASVVVHKEPQ